MNDLAFVLVKANDQKFQPEIDLVARQSNGNVVTILQHVVTRKIDFQCTFITVEPKGLPN